MDDIISKTQRTEYVEPGLYEDPVHGGLHHGVVPARHQEIVARRHHAEQPQAHEQQGAHRPTGNIVFYTILYFHNAMALPVGCCCEPVHHGDDDGADAEDADEGHVDQLRDKVAVEAVVEPGDEASDREEADTNIVQLAWKIFSIEAKNI